MRLLTALGGSALVLFPILCQYSQAATIGFTRLQPREDLTLLACLDPLGSKVLKRNTAPFEKNRYAFDLRYTFLPEVVVMATSTSDVQLAVKCAKAAGVAVTPRSGGHSFEGYCIGGQDGALVIDLSGLATVAVKNSTAKVGSGIRLGPLYLELYNQGGWTINAGTCPSVGIGGHALGGGFGLLSRKHGLLIDSIIEMEFVNADGAVLTVSPSENDDLFFALRGAGGGSYGVVTSFTFRVVKPASVVTSFTYDWKLSDHSKVLRAYSDYLSAASRDMGVELNISPDGLYMYGLFQGNKAAHAAAMAPFLARATKPTSSDIQEGRHIDGVLRFAYIYGDPTDIKALGLKSPYMPGDSRYTKGKSIVYRSALKDSTIAILAKWGAISPKGGTANYVIIDLWGGAVKDGKPEDAFVHRDAHTVIEFVTEWDSNPKAEPGKPDCQACIQWIEEMYAELLEDYRQSYGSSVPAYQNYIDKDMPDWETAYYGTAFTRLKEIKGARDPANVFRFPQSIPLP